MYHLVLLLHSPCPLCNLLFRRLFFFSFVSFVYLSSQLWRRILKFARAAQVSKRRRQRDRRKGREVCPSSKEGERGEEENFFPTLTSHCESKPVCLQTHSRAASAPSPASRMASHRLRRPRRVLITPCLVSVKQIPQRPGDPRKLTRTPRRIGTKQLACPHRASPASTSAGTLPRDFTRGWSGRRVDVLLSSYRSSTAISTGCRGIGGGSYSTRL